MGAPVTATELIEIDDLLRRQWLRLRHWADGLAPTTLRRPSVLDGWTVADLLAHLARCWDGLADVQPAPPGTVPLSLGEYVARYRDGADETAQAGRALAQETADEPLAWLDARAEAAFAQVSVLRRLAPDAIVLGRRGPIHLSEMLLTRLVELVVHGDDLLRSSGWPVGTDGPVDPQALRAVADAFLEVVLDRGGWDLELVDPQLWVRLAAGRVPYDTGTLTEALQATHTSDSVPDLGTMLPLL